MKFGQPEERMKLAMILINKHIKLSSQMASMSINDRPLIKQVMLRSCFRALMLYIFQTTTILLAALSVGAKTNFQWNSWTIFLKFLKKIRLSWKKIQIIAIKRNHISIFCY